MAITQQDIDRLDAAIARGERVVRFADRTVEYRSVDELIKARNDLRNEMSKASPTRRPRVARLFRSGKGV